MPTDRGRCLTRADIAAFKKRSKSRRLTKKEQRREIDAGPRGIGGVLEAELQQFPPGVTIARVRDLDQKILDAFDTYAKELDELLRKLGYDPEHYDKKAALAKVLWDGYGCHLFEGDNLTPGQILSYLRVHVREQKRRRLPEPKRKKRRRLKDRAQIDADRAQIDAKVRAAIAALESRGRPPKVRAVQKETGMRTATVMKAMQRLKRR
jgi:hypothetical protein